MARQDRGNLQPNLINMPFQPQPPGTPSMLPAIMFYNYARRHGGRLPATHLPVADLLRQYLQLYSNRHKQQQVEQLLDQESPSAKRILESETARQDQAIWNRNR